MKKLLCAGALALAVGGWASTANAALVQWTLTNVQFVDGGTASGSYVFDAATNTFSQISIATTGTEGVPAASYNNTCNGLNCAMQSPVPAQFLIFAPADTSDLTGKQVLAVDLQSAMTDTGGTIAINPPPEEPEQPELTVALRTKAFSTICPDSTCSIPGTMRFIASGEVVGRALAVPAAVATPVPTLAPWGLALLSLMLAPLAWLHKRRQR
ncbi:hypothetical protein GCM10027276_44360 [Comamonas piscis]